jgi:hypothetical protein
MRFGRSSNSHDRTSLALLDAAAHGLHMLPRVSLKRLPRMADFALWATACESAFRPAGTLETAYSNNRRNAIENIVTPTRVAACVREMMADSPQWIGSASDLLQIGTSRTGWSKSPRALAGRLRRAQSFLRTLGIEIVFRREGRLGMRTIRITAMGERPWVRTDHRQHRQPRQRQWTWGRSKLLSPEWNRRFNCADDTDGADAK